MTKTQLTKLNTWLEAELERTASHPTEYCEGYNAAIKETLAILKSLIAWN